ncbi:hypothetical protein DFP73DRAFT_541701 [Morchella snyderi]|nr:hypothetical protein DFP73DRAFT_541701 [Morchella snyderi]
MCSRCSHSFWCVIWQYGVGCAAESLISDTSRRTLTSAVTRTHNCGREQASCSPRNMFSTTLPSSTARYRLFSGGVGVDFGKMQTRWGVEMDNQESR